MTKKELLENRIFQMMPDGTEIVFNTSVVSQDCMPVTNEYLTVRSEIVQWCKKEISGGLEPIYKYFIVIMQILINYEHRRVNQAVETDSECGFLG